MKEIKIICKIEITKLLLWKWQRLSSPQFQIIVAWSSLSSVDRNYCSPLYAITIEETFIKSVLRRSNAIVIRLCDSVMSLTSCRPCMVVQIQMIFTDFHRYVKWYYRLFYNYVLNISLIQWIYTPKNQICIVLWHNTIIITYLCVVLSSTCACRLFIFVYRQ